MTVTIKDLDGMNRTDLRVACKDNGVPYAATEGADALRVKLAEKLGAVDNATAVDVDGDGVADAVVTKDSDGGTDEGGNTAPETNEAAGVATDVDAAPQGETVAQPALNDTNVAQSATDESKNDDEDPAAGEDLDSDDDDFSLPENIKCEDPQLIGIALAIEQGKSVEGFTYIPAGKVKSNQTVRGLKCTKQSNKGETFRLCQIRPEYL